MISTARIYPIPLILLSLLLALSASAGPAASTAILPPAMPWQGKSLSLICEPNHPWITPAEASGFKTTPRYPETAAWLGRLVDASPLLHMISLGRSHEGRDILMVIASGDRAFSPEALKASGKPTLLAQAGIHSGEIDGKDAGMMLLRDLTVVGSKRPLLDKANLLFIPILNIDGHERFSPYGRINQRGPAAVGWRTNAQNLNLNRDYAKLDSPGVRALVGALNTWSPDLYIDIHVTDGVDYQYDITWGYNGAYAYSPAGVTWMDAVLKPRLTEDLKAMGHIPGDLVFAIDDNNIERGISDGTAGLRYSNGYGDARHLPSILVENHSLKPYRQRVLGTYVLIESLLRVLGDHGQALKQAIQQDHQRRPQIVPLTWQEADSSPTQIAFLGVSWQHHNSPISGDNRITWTGQPVTLEIPLKAYTQADKTVTRPRAYWIPPAWTAAIECLTVHGIAYEHISTAKTINVEMYRLEEPTLASKPYEGRVRVSATLRTEKREQYFPSGSIRIPTDQDLGDLAVLLLEPACPDSLFQWGFFHAALQRTEYVEAYVMIPMAERMLAEDPNLAQRFAEKLADPNFAASPRARLQWFYQQTPFYDKQWRLYPVARELF